MAIKLTKKKWAIGGLWLPTRLASPITALREQRFTTIDGVIKV